MEISKTKILTAEVPRTQHLPSTVIKTLRVKLNVKIYHLLILMRKGTQKTNYVAYESSLLFDVLPRIPMDPSLLNET